MQDVHGQVADFASNGSKVLVLAEDLAARGIDRLNLLQQVVIVDKADLPAMLSGYDQVWHW